MAKYRISVVVEADSLAAAVADLMIDEDAQYVEKFLTIEAEPWD
jgi:hypothetical protein